MIGVALVEQNWVELIVDNKISKYFSFRYYFNITKYKDKIAPR